ncbi:hypothetical protein PYW08_009175 [Mythimna loreyi]|uniref:Uncharacterized protein n=1 Tax=Mythimna loreyi TaxID=667449 RepID=A0ACC2Q824_9NEOP|nr:hypothetical protein PYW08_009175 [Mythimna loreyi]
MRSFLGITAHFGVGIEFNSITIGVYQSNERHTSEHIAEMLLNTCTEWGIDKDNVSAVVTDNAANMVKAGDLAFGKKHIPCFAHILNLVAQNSIQQCTELRNLVTKVKDIVTWFKQSNIASNELRKATDEETKLIQEVPTSFTSTVEAATKEVSGDKYCTSSKVIPLIHCLVLKVESLQLEDSLGKDLQSLILREVAKRMGVIENVTPLAIATVLDPRFKKMHFTNPLACSSAITKIKDLMKTTAQNELESDSSDTSEKPEDNFSLWEDHHKLVRKNWKTTKTDGSIADELTIYLRSPIVGGRLNENPLEIWNDLEIQLPKLHIIAYKYLTMVGTSVSSERFLPKEH